MNKINWLNHFIELVVVFIGITAAFALNNWAETNAEEEREEKYISSLIEDMKHDTTHISYLRDFYVDNLETVRKLQNYTSEMNGDSAVIYSFRMLSFDYFSPQRNTFDAMKSSGDMNLISDFEVKNSLNKLYNFYAAPEQFDEMEQAYSEKYIIPYYWENFDLTKNKVIKKDFFTDKEFKNIIIGYIGIIQQKLRVLNNSYDLASKTLHQFENYREENF